MEQTTREQILTFINNSGQARASELQKYFNISRVAIHKHLNKLLEAKLIRKTGRPPLVFYTPVEKEEGETFALFTNLTKSSNAYIPSELSQLIDKTFLYITSDGTLLTGHTGFLYWVAQYKRGEDVLLHAEEYARVWREKEAIKSPEGWFDATINLKAAFPEVFIDNFLFEELYSIPTFGRTKLARLVMHAKESSNRELIDQISITTKPLIEKVITTFAIEAVAYIPPTIERPLQFMKELESQFNLPLPHIPLVKTKPSAGSVQRSQKSIKDIVERVENARNTIFLKNTQENPYQNVLLIDDAAGSGASFNETARKLKHRGIVTGRIVSFSLVGNLNLKKFPVIQQI